MPLTQQQQRNAEKLIDEHFHSLKQALRAKTDDLYNIPVESASPELRALAAARSEELKAERDARAVTRAKFIEDLEALGFSAKGLPGDPQPGLATTEYLIQSALQEVNNQRYQRRRKELDAAGRRIQEAHAEARRKVLIATLVDANEAKTLIDSLPDLATILGEAADDTPSEPSDIPSE